jgi:UDP-3-O-[3-hydroxymyristoyl] glucosamine N-acyltransferase
MSWALGDLAARFGCQLQGDPAVIVDHVAPLLSATPTALSFLANPKLAPQLAHTRAGAVVLAPRSAASCPVPALLADNPHALFARMAALLYPPAPLQPGIHPLAVVDVSASIDPSCEVGPHCVIGAGAVIGPRCYIGPVCLLGPGVRLGSDCHLTGRVSLEHGVQLGARVLIHPGAVIGADGFGLAREGSTWLKVPQVGSVRIGDDVEIGANTTIDRGAIGDTVIGDGVKLDNLIQIGHNVQVGAHTAIAGCAGISGSVRIGERCMIGGGAGLAGHIEICDDVVLSGMSQVSHSIKDPGVYSSVLPAEPVRRWRRIVARLKSFARQEERAAAARSGQNAMQQDHKDD